MFVVGNTFAAEESMINLQPSWRQGKSRGYYPGVRIALPDGRRTIIKRVLPNGQIETDLGVTLNPDGSLLESPDATAIILDPDSGAGGSEAILAESGEAENAEAPVLPEPVTRGDDVVMAPERPGAPEEAREDLPKAAVPEESEPERAPTPVAPQKPEAEKQLTLAELIPLTPAGPTVNKKAAEPEKEPAKNRSKTEKPQKEEKKPEKKPEKKTETPAPAKKPKTGQELRIPDEAIKSGSLDFLEGCWQGTRPEYYSKRIIKECFCFGAQGKNGKRRVIDPIGHRTCIGATNASLSKSGVLSVTSKGAACDDGERWGQAEMVCRNSGQKTPCSWVFRDANNGSQSYTIPFVRVESCGR